MMNPVVMICTYARLEITTANIRGLLAQSIVPKIVLIVSGQEETNYYRALFPEIIVEPTLNSPLGMKFQYGVMVAKRLQPNPLIITGSDDVLGKDFVKKACELVEAGNHFVGLKQWFILHKETLYLYDYRASIPLGTRVYSIGMLEAIRWKVFDASRERLLDDQGFHLARKTTLKMHIVTDALKEGLHVISVKGSWPMLNPYYKMKESANCKLVKQYDDPEGIL